MFLVAWSTLNQGINLWQLIDGEDAMQEFVSDLTDQGIPAEDIFVFNTNNRL